MLIKKNNLYLVVAKINNTTKIGYRYTDIYTAYNSYRSYNLDYYEAIYLYDNYCICLASRYKDENADEVRSELTLKLHLGMNSYKKIIRNYDMFCMNHLLPF